MLAETEEAGTLIGGDDKSCCECSNGAVWLAVDVSAIEVDDFAVALVEDEWNAVSRGELGADILFVGGDSNGDDLLASW